MAISQCEFIMCEQKTAHKIAFPRGHCQTKSMVIGADWKFCSFPHSMATAASSRRGISAFKLSPINIKPSVTWSRDDALQIRDDFECNNPRNVCKWNSQFLRCVPWRPASFLTLSFLLAYSSHWPKIHFYLPLEPIATSIFLWKLFHHIRSESDGLKTSSRRNLNVQY